MRLDSVEIVGYRSLYDVSVYPHDLTVLTGPNNSGKTNFVEALDFLADVYRHGLEVAIGRKGGIDNIVHRRVGRTKRSLAFKVEATIEETEIRRIVSEKRKRSGIIKVTHQFVVFPVSRRIDAEYQVIEERYSIRLESEQDSFFSYTRTLEGTEVKYDEESGNASPLLSDYGWFYQEDRYGQLGRRVRPTDLLLIYHYNPIETAFVNAIGGIRLYQLVPLECRRPGVPTPNADVDAHGANLPALVSYLRKNQPRAWAQVISSMQRIMPELLDIKTEFTTDRRLALQFVEKGVRRPWSAEDISDGTIQALGMYTAIFDPRPSLILFEEPENSLHSWVIRNFVDSCREAKGRQIILTTHSAALLSYLRPSELSLVWKRNGRTQIKPVLELEPAINELWSDGRLSVFEMLDSGLLRQAVPGNEMDDEDAEEAE